MNKENINSIFIEDNVINDIQNTSNKLYSFIQKYKEKKFEVILYGAGRGAYWAVKLLSKYNIHPKCIIDSNESQHGNYYFGIPIMSLQNAIVKYENVDFRVLIAAPKFEKEISEELKKYINAEIIYSFECELYYSFIFNMQEYKKYLIDNIEDLKKLYLSLNDEFSRKTLEYVIKGRLSGELHYFNEVFVPNQYFCLDIIKLSKQEVIIDAGANYGDTLEDIIHFTNGEFKKIYCLEPDKECIEQLNITKKQLEFENINIIDKGAWNETAKLSFSSDANHGASKIVTDSNKLLDEDNTYTIETTSLDNTIEELVTFIKMDIEGAELNALKGAQNIIRKYKPKLAICVYHKNEDLIEISKYIKSIVPEYKLYLRHHNVSGTETVMYAIP